MPSSHRPTIAYVAPFAAYVLLLALGGTLGLSPQVAVTLRFAVSALLLLLVSRPYLSLKASRPLPSALVGAAVFVLWIAPDLLFDYRHFWLFENPLFGRAESSMPADLRTNIGFLAVRCASSFLLVPILEELFWRGWLMRWMIRPDFLGVPFGTYGASAFWTVAVFFASEHGPYWEVGLAAGVVYNWWAVRTKCLADCIFAHAVTNALLSAYVLLAGQWQYWL